MSYSKISLIIPTLNAEKYIEKLLKIIYSQTVVPDEIVIIDSQSSDQTVEICMKHDIVRVIQIKQDEFDHGGTRNQAVMAAQGDIILMLSQDVTPIHNDYIEKLIHPLLEDKKIAACSGRQIAYEDASLREKLTREFNYKDVNFVRDISDLPYLGIKTYFLSDCCAAYRKKALLDCGLYEDPCLADEDMILASKLLNAGYKIAYSADAQVFHSHDYTLKKQYTRNFDIGAVMDIDSRFFGDAKAEDEGIKMVKYVLGHLLLKGHFFMAFYYCVDCAVRLKGHRDGKNWRKLSKEKLKKRTANLNYWKKIGYIM